MGVAYTRETIPLCEHYLSRFGGKSSVASDASGAKKGILHRLFS
jgi:hypothetical protein